MINYPNETKLREIESNLIENKFPPQIIIETTSYCNMKCLHCNHKILKRPFEHMHESLFKKIIDEIAHKAPETEIWPTFYGESLILGDKLFEKLEYARNLGLKNLILNSNGKLLHLKDYSYKILTSGLKRFIISLDGLTSHTFEKIRIGGNRDKIYSSIESLLEQKRKIGLIYPVIQCQFSVMEENWHEADDFKNYWQNKGAEVKIRKMLSWSNSGTVKVKNLNYNPDFRIACPWGNNTMAIHTNGNIVACACDWSGLFVAGNAREKSLEEIWNTTHYNNLRKLHREHSWGNIPEICKKCPDWQVINIGD